MSLSAELEHVRSEPSPLVAAHQHLAEHAVDTEKFEKLIENLQVSECHMLPLTLFLKGMGVLHVKLACAYARQLYVDYVLAS